MMKVLKRTTGGRTQQDEAATTVLGEEAGDDFSTSRQRRFLYVLLVFDISSAQGYAESKRPSKQKRGPHISREAPPHREGAASRDTSFHSPSNLQANSAQKGGRRLCTNR